MSRNAPASAPRHPQHQTPSPLPVRDGAAERVEIGLSGGVDSAVAAHLCLAQGYAVEGLFMKNWEEDDAPGYCSAAADLADAQAVANRLGIGLRTVNFATEYWERVFATFLAEYQALRTPNPDVLCNSEIKFRAFLEHALSLGADWIGTGHYARVIHNQTGSELRLARDTNKDQTYFLHRLTQQQLSRARFPLADLTKAEVRSLARELGLANAQKKDSTGICFIGERRFGDFLARWLPEAPGPIETPAGRRLGEHRGAWYTIGQRSGLGIGGVREATEAPWFVAAKDAARNALIVVQGAEHPLLYARGLRAEQVHWIAGQPPVSADQLPFDCLCRLRHRQPLQPCTLVEYDSLSCRVRFGEPQRAVTPGQSIVFYRGEVCLGGAVITCAESASR